jgi:hypothetical protein
MDRIHSVARRLESSLNRDVVYVLAAPVALGAALGMLVTSAGGLGGVAVAAQPTAHTMPTVILADRCVETAAEAAARAAFAAADEAVNQAIAAADRAAAEAELLADQADDEAERLADQAERAADEAERLADEADRLAGQAIDCETADDDADET